METKKMVAHRGSYKEPEKKEEKIEGPSYIPSEDLFFFSEGTRITFFADILLLSFLTYIILGVM